jgi:hypothetical protein
VVRRLSLYTRGLLRRFPGSPAHARYKILLFNNILYIILYTILALTSTIFTIFTSIYSSSHTPTPPTHTAVVYKDDQDALYGQNPDWKASENAKDLVLKRLKMAGFGENGDLLDVLKAASLPGGRFFDLGVKDNPIPLKSWSSESGRVILMGDSAHAM